jgi:four helix bundle protein
MRNFRELAVWKHAHELTVDIYRSTGVFPQRELYGLTSQIRRASASIGANVAEGAGRSSNADFARFLHISLGSANELQNHLLLARDLGFLELEPFARLEQRVQDIQRMLARFLQYLNGQKQKDLIPNS